MNFTPLKSSVLHLFIPLFLTSTPGNHWCSTVRIVLPFPECPVVVIMQSVAFSDWPPSLSNMLLRFSHIFSWLGSLFFSLTLKNYFNKSIPLLPIYYCWIFHCMDILQFIYLLKDILVIIFKLGIKLLYASMWILLCGCNFSVHLSKYPWVY